MDWFWCRRLWQPLSGDSGPWPQPVQLCCTFFWPTSTAAFLNTTFCPFLLNLKIAQRLLYLLWSLFFDTSVLRCLNENAEYNPCSLLPQKLLWKQDKIDSWPHLTQKDRSCCQSCEKVWSISSSSRTDTMDGKVLDEEPRDPQIEQVSLQVLY